MVDALVIAAFWIIALAAMAGGLRPILYLFFCAAPFGSLAVVPTALTGGLTFTPLPIVALLLIVRACLLPGVGAFLVHNLLRPRPLALIGLFWLVAVAATVFMPRLFAGIVLVVPVRVIEGSLAPLAPSIQNISQLFYLTISVATVVAAFVVMRREPLRQTVLHAIMAGAILTIVTGVLDLYAAQLGIEGLLESFRTATYNLLVDAETLGARRVVGLMPEASAFGSICVRYLALLVFLRHAFEPQDRSRRLIGPAIVVLSVFIYLSTSSAAYVGMAVVVAMAIAEWLIRSIAATGRFQRRQVGIDLALASICVLTAACVLVLSPRIGTMLWTSLDEIVFSKGETSSFAERGLWTATALQAAFDTFGLGVGVGGTRASNSLVALLSNVGILGAALYIAFVFVCYLQKARPRDEQGRWILAGCRWALLPGLVVGMLIGTSADFGAAVGFMYGMMLAIGASAPRRSPMLPRSQTWPGASLAPAGPSEALARA